MNTITRRQFDSRLHSVLSVLRASQNNNNNNNWTLIDWAWSHDLSSTPLQQIDMNLARSQMDKQLANQPIRRLQSLTWNLWLMEKETCLFLHIWCACAFNSDKFDNFFPSLAKDKKEIFFHQMLTDFKNLTCYYIWSLIKLNHFPVHTMRQAA